MERGDRIMKQEAEARLLQDSAGELRSWRRYWLRVGAIAIGVCAAVVTASFLWGSNYSAAAAWATWILMMGSVLTFLVASILYLTTMRRLDSVRYHQRVLVYAQQETAGLSHVTQARRAAGEAIEQNRRANVRYGLVTLVLLAGAMIVNVTTENETARWVAMVPALLGVITLVWIMDRGFKARARYDLADARRERLREQLNAGREW